MNHEILYPVAVGVILGVLGGLWRWWLRHIPGRILNKVLDKAAELIRNALHASDVKSMIRQIVHEETEPIKAELAPNHGASLRDAVDRLSREQANMLATIQDHSLREWTMRGFEDPDRAFFETDTNGKLIKISQQVCIWTGRSLPELIGDRWATIISPHCREQVKLWWADTWRDGSYGSMDQTYISANGEAIPVTVYAAPVIDPATNAYRGHVGSITRIDSGRPKAE